MAIIKCPECGHQTSDKAPVCPSCGVEIAGKIRRCPYCGEIYFKSDVVCPHCHKAADNTQTTQDTVTSAADAEDNTAGDGAASYDMTENTTAENGPEETFITPTTHNAQNDAAGNGEPEQKKNNTALLVSIVLALLILCIGIYVYNNTRNGNKENEDYEFAMKSDDPTVLQQYLDTYKGDAPEAHIDSINAHLQILMQQDQDWTNAVISGTKAALSDYLQSHPNSIHKQEALDKIDSIDWNQCSSLNTTDAYQTYMDEHPDGIHYTDADLALKKLKASVVSPDEKQTIRSVFRNFFLSINSKDKAGLVSNVNDNLNMLGKTDATKEDVVTFMQKLYERHPDIKEMVWSLSNNYNIQKKEIGDDQYEYSVSFMAEQRIDNNDNTSVTNKFKINAKLNPDWLITVFSMTKINE